MPNGERIATAPVFIRAALNIDRAPARRRLLKNENP
jgi:hypothetical protein